MKALIIVDLQNDFLPQGALAVPSGNDVIEIANQMISLKGAFFNLIVATQDWHPKDHKSFASQHKGKEPGQVITLNGLTQVLWPNHCVQGTPGAELASSLNLKAIDQIVQKGTDCEIDSYSGFFDNGKKKATGLAQYLKSKNVKEIFILGLATDYCVKFTALDAISLGFSTFLIEDGCRGVNLKPTDVQDSVEEMKRAGVKLIQSREVRI